MKRDILLLHNIRNHFYQFPFHYIHSDYVASAGTDFIYTNEIGL